MNKEEKKVDKFNIGLAIIYKSTIFICWYLFALIFYNFVSDTLSDNKIVEMSIYLLIVYLIRICLKSLYKRIAYNSFYTIKHSIELEYFKRLKDIKNDSLITMDKKKLSKTILKYAFFVTKLTKDIGEVLIPLIIGVIVFFIITFNLNIIVGIISIIIIAISLILAYKDIDKDIKVNNYNDLLIDFINKIETIRKLKIFDYCTKKLDTNNENDICILKDGENVTNSKVNAGVTLVLLILFITIFMFSKDTSSKLALIIFFCVMTIKLQDLLYQFILCIKEYYLLIDTKKELENFYQDKESLMVMKKWKNVHVKDVTYTYASGIKISIPNFELIRGDQIGIMGKSGQGKSTILSILNGDVTISVGNIFYDSSASKKVIDAITINNKVELLNLSLKENLTLGNEITDEEVIEYIKEIGLYEWYQTLPDGLDTIMESSLIDSNSIVQRINIIRSIILDKEIYFFDEPTLNSNLEVEKQVASIIKKYFSKKTFIIVTQRPLLTNLCKKHYFIKDHTLLEKESLL